MNKMLLAVVCLGMVGSANMFALDLGKILDVAISMEDLQKNGPSYAKDMTKNMNDANKETDSLAKAMKALKAAGPALSITEPTLKIMQALASVKLSPRVNSALDGVIKSLKDLNTNLKSMSDIADVLG